MPLSFDNSFTGGAHSGAVSLHIIQYDKEYVVEAKFRELEKESCSSSSPSDISFMHSLKNNTDLLACKAEYYHQCGELQKCFELTSVWVSKVFKTKI